jgi:hypothetical protein
MVAALASCVGGKSWQDGAPTRDLHKEKTMRRLLGLMACLLLIGPAFAADEAKPNTLTAKEISDGWLLLFDGETTFGWKIDGDAQVKDGVLILGGGKETTATFTTMFRDCQLQLQFASDDTQAVKLVLIDNDGRTGKLDTSGAAKNHWTQATYNITSKSYSGMFGEPGKNATTGFKTGAIKEIADLRSTLKVQVPKGVQFQLRDVKLKPTGTQALFDGKDLTGWKEHPGKKSKFTVVDGAINIKDGPGDLQTDGQWSDFVLQLECISNGKHLNSGVFFRCRPGEYQQGYEAQVHNGFGEQPKEYTLEDYDPQTNKLIGTRKEKYTALDYGTGAIYRRQPARKQMSKDNEWFAMTVVAQGRHIGVWVNGVQVTDWTDNRPLADNARKGAMLERGNISLQGHDPTTDLSFRNFRIAELAAEKPKAKE